MPVAAAIAASLDGRVRRHRIWTGIAFIPKIESDSYFSLGTWHRNERNANWRSLVKAGAKISMPGAGGASLPEPRNINDARAAFDSLFRKPE